MKKYRVSHSELTNATPDDVWALWSDVKNWPKWDEGVDAATPKAGFQAGHSLMLRPKGAPMEFEVKLVDVRPGERFSDETRLPFGTIRAIHVMEKVGNKTKVTHTIEADIEPGQAKGFEQGIWSGMEHGIAHSVRGLVKLAEQRKGK